MRLSRACGVGLCLACGGACLWVGAVVGWGVLGVLDWVGSRGGCGEEDLCSCQRSELFTRLEDDAHPPAAPTRHHARHCSTMWGCKFVNLLYSYSAGRRSFAVLATLRLRRLAR